MGTYVSKRVGRQERERTHHDFDTLPLRRDDVVRLPRLKLREAEFASVDKIRVLAEVDGPRRTAASRQRARAARLLDVEGEGMCWRRDRLLRCAPRARMGRAVGVARARPRALCPRLVVRVVERDGVVWADLRHGAVRGRGRAGLVRVEGVGVLGCVGRLSRSPVADALAGLHVAVVGLGRVVDLSHGGQRRRGEGERRKMCSGVE